MKFIIDIKLVDFMEEDILLKRKLIEKSLKNQNEIKLLDIYKYREDHVGFITLEINELESEEELEEIPYLLESLFEKSEKLKTLDVYHYHIKQETMFQEVRE